jgi:fanconi anemia group J protein
VIGKSPKGTTIKANYESTDKVEFQDAVGDVLVLYSRIVPEGLLLFLPSYRLMHLLVNRWKLTRHWRQLEQHKRVFVEPQDLTQLPEVLKGYYDAIDAGEGAILLAVCRGKVSEGINFSDQYARAVLVVGIPFPNIRDPKVVLKQAYNNRRHSKNREELSGKDWYQQQGFRALNQALGRCIRHIHDYGAIILIGKWMKPTNLV